eukprot:10308816-Karenia_brevis.AAC.1
MAPSSITEEAGLDGRSAMLQFYSVHMACPVCRWADVGLESMTTTKRKKWPLGDCEASGG